MARIVRLVDTWEIGETIGAGGFGKVHTAKSSKYPNAAAKFVPKAHGASRELLFVNLTGVRNVVPTIDSGETNNDWVIVMPRAEKSLQDVILATAGPFEPASAVKILTDISTALADMDGKLIHRDLKPANVLHLDGIWCLADFGIARYAEATTAPETLKYAMSPQYAAPERWRSERASIASDVYSFGVIAYQLLTGALPFSGCDVEELRDQHLHGSVAFPPNSEPMLATIVDECLYKAPGSRPSPSSLLARLRNVITSKPGARLAKLQNVNRAEVARLGKEGAVVSKIRSSAEEQAALFAPASEQLKAISASVKAQLTEAATVAVFRTESLGAWSLQLNQAKFKFRGSNRTATAPWGQWEPPAFNVVAHSKVSITIPKNRYGYEGRSHSLWYCDAQEKDRFHWFETAFMISPLIQAQTNQTPFALEPGERAAKCFWAGIAEVQLAWPMTPLKLDSLEEFIERWAEWLADAAEGRLNYPSAQPERSPGGSWRTK